MYNGPEPDVLYLKQSFMCARILFESRERENMNVAWKMVTDLAHYYGKREEARAYTGSVRTFNARLAGIDRIDLHYVPFYTKGKQRPQPQPIPCTPTPLPTIRLLSFVTKTNTCFGNGERGFVSVNKNPAQRPSKSRRTIDN